MENYQYNLILGLIISVNANIDRVTGHPLAAFFGTVVATILFIAALVGVWIDYRNTAKEERAAKEILSARIRKVIEDIRAGNVIERDIIEDGVKKVVR